MDEFAEFRDDLVFAFLLIAAAPNAKNPQDQYDTARDFLDAMHRGEFRFTPDEGLNRQLATALSKRPKGKR